MRHSEKSENITQGRRSLVIASQAVGVLAVCRPHRRPIPVVSGQSFFPKDIFLGPVLSFSHEPQRERVHSLVAEAC